MSPTAAHAVVNRGPKWALRRIWNAVQNLNDAEVPATPEAKVEEPTAEQPAPAKKERKARAKKAAEPKQPRDTKKAKVMEMIARAEGWEWIWPGKTARQRRQS